MSIKDFEKAFLNLYLFYYYCNYFKRCGYIGQFVYPIHTRKCLSRVQYTEDNAYYYLSNS